MNEVTEVVPQAKKIGTFS